MTTDASAAQGNPISVCPGPANVCMQVAIPDQTAQAGKGNIYFQISAPTSYTWVALGTGTQMSGSNIFLMYQDGQGNLTLSPREGKEHQMPTLDTSSTAAQLTLLAGSGVNGDTMTANIECANCETWTAGGSLSVTSSNSPWIAAWKSGPSLASTDPAAAITQHDDTGQFTLDLTQAAVSSDSNPFVASSGGNGSSSSSNNSSSGGSGSGSSGSGGSPSGSGVTIEDSGNVRPPLQVGHGVIMSVVMVILFPLGALLMPGFRDWRLHAAVQMLAFVLMWIGFGLGVVFAKQQEEVCSSSRHPRLLSPASSSVRQGSPAKAVGPI